jgi:hypothetical protein
MTQLWKNNIFIYELHYPTTNFKWNKLLSFKKKNKKTKKQLLPTKPAQSAGTARLPLGTREPKIPEKFLSTKFSVFVQCDMISCQDPYNYHREGIFYE